MVYFRQFHDVRSHSFSYLLADLGRREAVIIDPVAAAATLYLAVLDEIQAGLSHVLLTHGHRLGASGAAGLQQTCGAVVIVGERCPPHEGATATKVGDGDTVVFGDEILRCRATPGHTACCMCYHWRDRVFTGDTLPIVARGTAETDNEDPGSLFDSLTRKLLTLPDETLVYPGHDFAGRRVSCIGEERDANPVLTGASRDEFIARFRPASASGNRAHSIPRHLNAENQP